MYLEHICSIGCALIATYQEEVFIMRNQGEDQVIRAVRDRELWEFADENEELEYERGTSFIKYKNRNVKDGMKK